MPSIEEITWIDPVELKEELFNPCDLNSVSAESNHTIEELIWVVWSVYRHQSPEIPVDENGALEFSEENGEKAEKYRFENKIKGSSFNIHKSNVKNNNWKDCKFLRVPFCNLDWKYEFINHDSDWENLHYQWWDVHYYLIARHIYVIDRDKDNKVEQLEGYYVVDSNNRHYWPYSEEIYTEIIKDFWKFIEEKILKHKTYEVWDTITFRRKDGSSQTIKIKQIVGDKIFGICKNGWWLDWCNMHDVIAVKKRI